MAPMQWTDLPGEILDAIAKLADSEIDLLRLRSVCSSWRSSLSPPPQSQRFTFPLDLPPIRFGLFSLSRPWDDYNEKIGFHKLHEDTLYRLSSPRDPSNGWMFKASKLSNPNSFSLLIPLTNKNLQYPPNTIPNPLNLLDYQISEIDKSYSYRLNGVVFDDGLSDLTTVVNPVKKVITLFNYVMDSDLVVLALGSNGNLIYWKVGDVNWTPIDTEDRKFRDLVLCDGVCYVLDRKGVLLSFNSKLLLKVVAPSPGYHPEEERFDFLLKCDSDLYMALKKYSQGPGPVGWYLDELKLSKFNKSNGNWERVKHLGDKIFLLSEAASISICGKDFQGCKGNCVYLCEYVRHVSGQLKVWLSRSEVYGDKAIIYHLDNGTAVEMKADADSRKLYWPPPSWLMLPGEDGDSGKLYKPPPRKLCFRVQALLSCNCFRTSLN